MLFSQPVHFGFKASDLDARFKDTVLLLLALFSDVFIIVLLPICVDIGRVSVMDNSIELRFQLEGFTISFLALSLQSDYLILSCLIDGSLPFNIRCDLVVSEL